MIRAHHRRDFIARCADGRGRVDLDSYCVPVFVRAGIDAWPFHWGDARIFGERTSGETVVEGGYCGVCWEEEGFETSAVGGPEHGLDVVLVFAVHCHSYELFFLCQ